MRFLIFASIMLASYAGAYQVCKSPVDVVLLVEDSAYLPADEEQQLKAFLAAFANYFTLGSQYDQLAYVQYSDVNKTIFHLNTYSETNDAKSAILRNSFKRSPYLNAPLIAPALEYVWSNELSVTNGERSCFPTVVLLVSYSAYADPNGLNGFKESQEAADLSAARRLRNSDALIITVGVGKDRNPGHLIELASDDSNYHDFPDFTDLSEDAAIQIAAEACAYKTDGVFYPCEMQTVQADVVFAVDISDQFNAAYADDIVTFIRKFLAPYHYDHKTGTGVQAALVLYGKVADVTIQLGDAKDTADFINEVQYALNHTCSNCVGPNRCVYKALELINTHVFDESNPRYRPTCTLHQIYFFTSGCLTCPDDPIPLAGSLRTTKNAEIFVVPLQPNPSFGFWKEPLEIAGDAEHIYEVQNDPASIMRNYLHKQVWRQVCVARDSLFCPSTTTLEPVSMVTLYRPTSTSTQGFDTSSTSTSTQGSTPIRQTPTPNPSEAPGNVTAFNATA